MKWINLVGCPVEDLGELPQLFQSSQLHLRPLGGVQDGDNVVFCISCVLGPTEGTRAAVDQCAGRTIVPVAIVLTRAELVDNDSLRELVKCEEMNLLTRILPSDAVERLPIYYDFDPGLVRKIESIVNAGPESIECAQ